MNVADIELDPLTTVSGVFVLLFSAAIILSLCGLIMFVCCLCKCLKNTIPIKGTILKDCSSDFIATFRSFFPHDHYNHCWLQTRATTVLPSISSKNSTTVCCKQLHSQKASVLVSSTSFLENYLVSSQFQRCISGTKRGFSLCSNPEPLQREQWHQRRLYVRPERCSPEPAVNCFSVSFPPLNHSSFKIHRVVS